MKALLLVDLQYDFLPGGPLEVEDGDKVVPVANRLMPRFERIVATQDWHPENHASFAVHYPGKKIGDHIDLDGVDQILWPVHCVQGSHGAELVEALNQEAIDEVIKKGTDPRIDSYSGFFDNEHRKKTRLDDYLKSQNVEKLFIMGLATDICVKFTVLDALELGYEVVLITDGCRGVNLRKGDSERALEEMKSAGAKLTTSQATMAQI